MISCISNPPYNLKWEIPFLAQMQPRFMYGVPPKSNANLAFILTALDKADRVAMLLPCGVLTSEQTDEKAVKKTLVKHNQIAAIITCPNRMFESTSIPTCIIVLDKHKTTALVEMIDMRNKYEVEVRDQNGQWGGAYHEKRTYHKNVNVLTDEIMTEAITAIDEHKSIEGYCKAVTATDIENQDWRLTPSTYIDMPSVENNHRPYKDIVADINAIVRERNRCKLTMNETLAKRLGLDLIGQVDYPKKFQELIEKVAGEKIEKDNHFITTKRLVLKFENTDKEQVSSLFMMLFNMWKQHIYFLNNEENRYLAELRDGLLPELMSGSLEIEGNGDNND